MIRLVENSMITNDSKGRIIGSKLAQKNKTWPGSFDFG
jgi:hypothetical protein